MSVIQEFYLEIKPKNIVRRQALCKLDTKSQDLARPDDWGWDNELSLWCSEVLNIPLSQDSWYSDLPYFLHYGTCPEHLNPKERRALGLKSAQYCLINSMLFCNNYDRVFLRCLEKEDVEKVLRYLHDGPASGHFVCETSAHKILGEGYYWPTFFRDAHKLVRKWKFYQLIVWKEKRSYIPLQPVTISRPF